MMGNHFLRWARLLVLIMHVRLHVHSKHSKCACTSLAAEKVVGPKPDQPNHLLLPCFYMTMLVSFNLQDSHPCTAVYSLLCTVSSLSESTLDKKLIHELEQYLVCMSD